MTVNIDKLRQRNLTNSTSSTINGCDQNTNDELSSSTNNKNDKKMDTTIYIVFISLLLDLLAFTMILPLFPSILEFYKTNDNSGLYSHLSKSIKYFQQYLGAPEKYNSVLFGGILGSMFSFLQFVSSPIVGALSDVYGRKPLMLICAFGISLSYLIWALSHNFAIFVLARFIGGLSKGNISLSMAIITDVSNTTNRGKAMALVGIAFSVGFIVGPMIGAMFAMYTDRTSISWFWLPAMFSMALAVFDFLFIGICLKESLPKQKRAKHIISSLTEAIEYVNIPSLFSFSAVKNIKKNELECLKKIGFIYFTYLFIYSGLEFTVTFLMYHKFGYTSIDQAKMFCTTGIIMAILQGSVVRRLRPELIKSSAVFGLYLIIPAFIFVGLANNSFILYFGMILFAISTAFVITCLTTMVSQYGNFDQKGTVLGIFRSLGALARAIGPFVGSIAFWGFGSTLTYILGGILLIYPAVLLQRLNIL